MGNILHKLEAAEDDANLAFLRSEVARLRLTDAEREAVSDMCDFAEDFLGDDDPNIVTLRSLLARQGTTGHQE